ncbi:NADH:ubiquinone oxidoreductase subunit 39 [Osmia lignaria lignaria]|uniref:NADH:ubiquinone oxidoreductase subunit 39 n=1 Tax=Osmia lignaria lignaria TaxID=1437193 RepID=UPI0014783A38|nr:NADH dehydrogenase [ubiquinone] 1 alpha subcomplex subunit 9, mitochondrial [Osmia lignaria]XP_034184974.1 NADH dehydrogenase [ubiquinone] 1 alpha subcomplex subunit 9, mitochondrial [Osmia lignaria]
MAAWLKTAIQAAKSQNVYAASYAIQSRDCSSKPYIIKNPTTASLKRGTGGRSSFNGVVCTIFGCSGFIGSYVCNRLGKIGTQLILPYRGDHYHVRPLKVCGDLGQVLFHPFHLKDEESILKSMKYSNVVINLISSYYPTSNFSYHDVNVKGARRIARLAKECGVERFIHVSCLNASEKPKPLMIKNGSEILKTKWEGECAVKEEFPEATIIRPATIYGQEDNFITHYMNAWRRNLKTVPLWEGGEKTEKQPVHISDVAAGITAVATNPLTAGKTYEFIGPRRYKLIALVKWFYEIASRGQGDYYKIIDMKYNPLFRLKIELNEFIHRLHRTQPMNWEILEINHTSDNINPGVPTLEDLGITPCTMESRMQWELMPYRFENHFIETVDEQKASDPETIPIK